MPFALHPVVNFGEERFTFRANDLVAPYQESRRRQFSHTAKLLPPEILRIVALYLAALAYGFVSKNL